MEPSLFLYCFIPLFVSIDNPTDIRPQPMVCEERPRAIVREALQPSLPSDPARALPPSIVTPPAACTPQPIPVPKQP